jgi:hypothetical protein
VAQDVEATVIAGLNLPLVHASAIGRAHSDSYQAPAEPRAAHVAR